MSRLLLKLIRYAGCYYDLSLGARPSTLEGTIDYCVDRPILMGQERSEIVRLARLLEGLAPKRSLEIGTNYGGTLFLLCSVSAPDAKIISVDLPYGPFGGGYPRRKIPLFRKFPKGSQKLHLIRADSHSADTKNRIVDILGGEMLDYLFIDGDHTYEGVSQDFETYSPLVRSGGIVAFHDIVTYKENAGCRVAEFWRDIKQRYNRHLEIVENPPVGSLPVAVTREPMNTAGIGLLYMP